MPTAASSSLQPPSPTPMVTSHGNADDHPVAHPHGDRAACTDRDRDSRADALAHGHGDEAPAPPPPSRPRRS
ncbi:MAG: hypothetical protein U0232_07110 [Thermomicrobiales bacterium]